MIGLAQLALWLGTVAKAVSGGCGKGLLTYTMSMAATWSLWQKYVYSSWGYDLEPCWSLVTCSFDSIWSFPAAPALVWCLYLDYLIMVAVVVFLFRLCCG